ncbi:MAG: DEAD/DEAH box helicase, partial [Bacteroidetes bacterium]
MQKSRDILESYWGYSFRPLQEEIVDNAIYGHDTLAILPTGGGKSICFQVPGIAREGITVVISPLIALMEDQV